MLNYECKVETKSPIRRQLTISVKPDSIQEYIEGQFKALQKTAKVKGFREGKVPVSILKQYYMSDVKSEVYSQVIRDSYLRALEENKIQAVGMPQIETQSGADLKEGEELKYTATIEIFPEIAIENLAKIKVTRESEEVSDADVDKSIQNLRDNHADIVPNTEYDGPARTGDFVDISFKGTVDGKELDSLKGDNKQVEIGSGNYMEAFENALIGMKKGESKDFPLEFAKDFAEPQLAGKTAQFNVTIHEFKKKQLPEVDDEFAKRFKMETSLELRKKVFETLKEDREQKSRSNLRENVLRELVKAHTFEVPGGLIQSQLEFLVRENVEYLKNQGFTEKMIRDYLDKNQEQLKARAEEQVRASLILDQIAKDQSIKVEQADLDSEYAKVATRTNLPVQQIQSIYEQDENGLRQLRFRLKEDRTMDYVLSQVKVTDAK